MDNQSNIPPEVIEFLARGGQSLLVKGGAGTGKTTFALELLRSYRGKGAYLSTRVTSHDLYRQFPWLRDSVPEDNIIDAQKPYEMKKDAFEADSNYLKLPDSLKKLCDIAEESTEAIPCVIDSWDVVAEQLKPSEADVSRESWSREELEPLLLHTIKPRNADLIMVMESDEKVRLDYLVDGIITLEQSEVDGRAIRTIRIHKLRGIKRRQPAYLFTLENGRFKYIEPFKPFAVKERKRFVPILDSKAYFSTGSKDLDKLLGGGYPQGSYVFLDVGKDVAYKSFSIIPMLTAANFVTQGRPVAIIPVGGVGPDTVKYTVYLWGLENELNLFRVAAKESPAKPESEEFVFTYKAEDVDVLYEKWRAEMQRLTEDTGESVLGIVGFDTMESLFGKERMTEIISLEAQTVVDNNSLCIVIGKHSTPETNKVLADTSHIHLKIEEKNGSLLFYGIKPKTVLHSLEIDVSKGYPDLSLTPIV